MPFTPYHNSHSRFEAIATSPHRRTPAILATDPGIARSGKVSWRSLLRPDPGQTLDHHVGSFSKKHPPATAADKEINGIDPFGTFWDKERIEAVSRKQLWFRHGFYANGKLGRDVRAGYTAAEPKEKAAEMAAQKEASAKKA